ENELYLKATPNLTPRLTPYISMALQLPRVFEAEGLNRLIPGARDTLLTRAAKTGDLAAAEQLLNLGAHVNQINADGYSPLMAAVEMQHLELVRLLLQHGAKPNQSRYLPQAESRTFCLDVTIASGSVAIAQELLTGTHGHAPAQVRPQHVTAAART